jgi:hypothetical protein
MICRAVILCALLLQLGCQRSPEAGSAPPGQNAPVKLVERPTKPFIEMNDPAVKGYIVQDINDFLEASTWRWTFNRPELRFYLAKTENLQLEIDFAIAGATLKDTGPVTVSTFVNGKPLGEMKCAKATDYKFVKAVPANWLNTDDATLVAAEVRPLWKTPDGKQLGFILIRAGFVPQGAK